MTKDEKIKIAVDLRVPNSGDPNVDAMISSRIWMDLVNAAVTGIAANNNVILSPDAAAEISILAQEIASRVKSDMGV